VQKLTGIVVGPSLNAALWALTAALAWVLKASLWVFFAHNLGVTVSANHNLASGPQVRSHNLVFL
jgi:hypothetical protein